MRRWPALALTFGLTLVACSKSSGPVQENPVTVSKRVLPGTFEPEGPGPAPAAEAPQDTPTSTSSGAGHEFIAWDGSPTTYTVTEKIDAASLRPDPNLAVLAAAREEGASCFSGLQGGPDVRYAVIQVVVVPSGSVTRTEVSGASEPEVIDCLRRVGAGLHFSSQEGAGGSTGGTTKGDNGTEGIRSFSIDIHVSRAH
jgi:hypothetical protein